VAPQEFTLVPHVSRDEGIFLYIKIPESGRKTLFVTGESSRRPKGAERSQK